MKKDQPKPKSVVREYAEALLTAALLAFLIRSFIIEPYKIPSQSMLPTLLVGDHIFVNKFIYGLRIPGTTKWLVEWGSPQRGDVLVFIFPEDHSLDFVKRCVGLPGDKVRFHHDKIYLNNELVYQQDIPIAGINSDDKRLLDVGASNELGEVPEHLTPIPYYTGYKDYKVKLETLDEHQHLVQNLNQIPIHDEYEVTVPAGHYFVLGDNRDESADSRIWGFVPRENLKGRALFVWLSLDHDLGGIRFGRFGREIF